MKGHLSPGKLVVQDWGGTYHERECKKTLLCVTKLMSFVQDAHGSNTEYHIGCYIIVSFCIQKFVIFYVCKAFIIFLVLYSTASDFLVLINGASCMDSLCSPLPLLSSFMPWFNI